MPTPYVNTVKTAQIEIFRSTSASSALWQPNQCFELSVKSPYANPADYMAFSQTPVCTAVTSGITVACQLKGFIGTTLQFQFTSMSVAAQNLQSLRFTFTNFNMPYSTQQLSGITARSFSDAECSQGMQQVSVPSITPQPAYLPSNAIQVSSSSNLISDTDPATTLTVTFTSTTKLAPSGSGRIEIGIPIWYQIGTLPALMYNPDAINLCTSTCMTVKSSILQVKFLNIQYSNMTQACINGSPITIQCPGFYNPIYQDVWSGFFINIYDNEVAYQSISKSDLMPSLDATKFMPYTMHASQFTVMPSDKTVNTYSEWTITMTPALPLMQECYIRMYIPTDIQFQFQSIDASGIFIPNSRQSLLTTSDVVLLQGTSSEPRQSILFSGCYDLTSLGLQPSGRIFINFLKTQVAVMDSNPFSVEIYKDDLLTQKIAVLAADTVISASNIEPGYLTNLQVRPLVHTVQLSTLLYFNFTTKHTLYPNSMVSVEFPPSLTLPKNGTLNVFGLASESSGAQQSTYATLANITDNKISIYNFVNQVKIAPYNFVFAVDQVHNQMSCKDAGSFNVTTYYHKQGAYAMIDTIKVSASFIATPNTIDASGQIIVSDPTNNLKNVSWSFNFRPPSAIPKLGQIQIDFPSTFSIDFGNSCENCFWVSNTSVRFKQQASSLKNEELQLIVYGVQNPRSFMPTSTFQITTYDTDGSSMIDTGFNINKAMTKPGSISSFLVSNLDQTNGALTTYTFELESAVEMVPGDLLFFTFPQETRLKDSQCTSNSAIVCFVSGNNVKITLAAQSSSLRFNMTQIVNPPSLEPSSYFTNILITDYQSYTVSYLDQAKGVTNKTPGQLQQLLLIQDSYLNSTETPYTLQFTPANPLPRQGSIVIQYPYTITLIQNASCVVTTYAVFSNACLMDPVNRKITVQGVFNSSGAYSSQITVTVTNFTNPIDNYQDIGFNITTYSGQYVVDLSINQIKPLLACDYPCATCQGTRKNCTSCWQTTTLRYLMTSSSQPGRCEAKCDFGFTSNGRVSKVCEQCDQSCVGCQDFGKFNDVTQCLSCSPSFKFRINNTLQCLKECSPGLFEISDTQCGYCSLPCQTCAGVSNYCTSCNQDSTLPNLYNGKCVSTCPAGTTSIAGICKPCQSPCQTCNGTQQQCLTCDKTYGRDILFNQMCFKECPIGYATNFTQKTCVGCQPGCDLCNLYNTQQCLLCSENLALYNETCFANCPEGYKAKNRVCINNLEEDLYVMYFPFLIASIIFIAVVLVGKLKRKAILIDGTMRLVSTQHSVPTICAFLGPLQTLCIIVQFVLAYYFGYMIHFILALIVYLVQLVFNGAFILWFIKNFFSKIEPPLGSTIVVRGRPVLISWQNQRQNLQDIDPEFAAFVEKHKLTTWLLFLLTGGLHFNLIKMFYSHYWSFGSFKARWSRATYFRTRLVRWQLAYAVIVDLTLVVISVFGLATIRWSNQLWICMVEQIVLALVLVVLGLVELIQIKSILRYTEDQSQKYQPALIMNKFHHRLQLNQRVKVKQHFNNRKLQELLELFGSKKCQSFIEIRRDYEEHQDDREIVTWPISPRQQEDALRLDLPKFTTADQYYIMDNVYCVAVTKNYQTIDISLQAGEFEKQEFLDALNRKQNVFLSESLLDPVNDVSATRKLRKRGRQNKYYYKIEQEDDESLDEAATQKIVSKLIKTQMKKDQAEIAKNVLQEAERMQRAALKLQQQLDEEEEQLRLEMEAKEQLELTQRNLIDGPSGRQELERLKLIEQLEQQKQEKIRKEEAEQRKNIEQSFKLRNQLEQQEFERLLKVHKDNERLQAEKAVKEQQLQKKAKQRAIKDKLKAQTEQQIQVETVPESYPYSYQQPVVHSLPASLQLSRDSSQKSIQVSPLKQPQTAVQIMQPLSLQTAVHPTETIDLKQDDTQEQMEKARQRQIQQAKLKIAQQSSIASDDAKSERILLNHNYHQSFSNPHQRLFNENDCLGDFDRDAKANIVMLKSHSGYHDKQGRQTNQKGFLINTKTQAVIDQKGATLFKLQQLDAAGELPMPFALERYNFNAHQISGDFDYYSGQIQLQQTSTGFVDKRGNRVNEQGWLVDGGRIVDNLGNPKLCMDKVPLLYNFKGKKFDVRNVMGQFKKERGLIVINDQKDLQGRLCNEKGYLVDKDGNIIDNQSRQIWAASDLIQGEFMKIFSFTRFDISQVLGDLKIIDGYPQPHKQPNGSLVDQSGNLVNQKGYLVNAKGDVVNQKGDKVFDQAVLSEDGEIPQVFRSNLLRDDTASSISRLMSEIERGANNQSEMLRQDGSDTSLDSKMADTPANYNIANQRYEAANKKYADTLQSDFTDNDLRVISKKRKKHKKKRFLKPTPRQQDLAGAYGGEVKLELRRPRVKYDRDRLKGSQQFNGVQSKPQAQYSETHRAQELEDVYAKEIDQFLEDSEWDIDQLNLDQLSESSDGEKLRARAEKSLQAMERNYLGSQTTITQKRLSKLSASPKKPAAGKFSLHGPSRETILNVTDDPVVIHKGATLEFETRF